MENKWIIWCNLNSEQDELERIFKKDCVSVRGSTPDDQRINLLNKWLNNQVPIMITKPKVFGLGLNFQHCNNAAFVGLSDSWEQFYQACRRIWRFGQTKEVNIHIFIEEREGAVLKNIQRKDDQAKAMINAMVSHMKEITKQELGHSKRTMVEYKPVEEMELPEWL